MRKIFLLFAIAGILASCSEDEVYIPEPSSLNFSNRGRIGPDRTPVVGKELRIMVILEDIPKVNNWTLEFFVNDQLIETESLKTYKDGGAVVMFHYTPSATGDHFSKVCLTNRKTSSCQDIDFEVM